MSHPRILILGANGQVGHALAALTEQKAEGMEVLSTTRAQVDVSNPDALAAVLSQFKPNAVINAVAYTNVEKAEDEPEKAHRINAEAVGELAQWCRQAGALLVHYSTDYVFDGTSTQPYTESDACNPLSAYGKSKRAGERFIDQVGGHAVVFRTGWVYGAHGDNFFKKMLAFGRQRPELSIVTDQVGAPTPAHWLAELAWDATVRFVQPTPTHTLPLGIFHASAAGQTHWNAYAQYVFDLAQGSAALPQRPLVKEALTSAMGFKAQRPAYSVLDNTLRESAFDVQRHPQLRQPHWQAALLPTVQSHLSTFTENPS